MTMDPLQWGKYFCGANGSNNSVHLKKFLHRRIVDFLNCAHMFLFFLIRLNWRCFVLHKMKPLKWQEISFSTDELSHFFAEHAYGWFLVCGNHILPMDSKKQKQNNQFILLKVTYNKTFPYQHCGHYISQ